MTISNDLHNKSDKLVRQLAGLRYIVDTNLEIINKDPVAKDFLAFKMDIVLSCVEELEAWKTLGNQGKCDSAIANAQFFLEQAQVLLDRMLDRYCEEAWLDFLRESKFTRYTSADFVKVLGNDTQARPSSVAG